MIDFSKHISEESRERLARERADFEARAIPVRAIRTDAWTGAVRSVDIHMLPDGEWLKLVGGVTGYESIRIVDIGRAIEAGGWLACMGTEKRWDRLMVPAEELQKVRFALGSRKEPA